MLEWLGRRMMIRLVIGLVVACAALLIMGTIEAVRCTRWLLPATQITLAEATGPDGLARFGHVKITDGTPSPDLIVKTDRNGDWHGAFAVLHPAPGAPPAAGCTVVAWFPDAQAPEDIGAYLTDHGLEGFVEGRADYINPGDQQALRGRTGPDPSRCWVLRLRRPSWLKAIALLGGGAALTTLSFLTWAWKERRALG
ncbi:MAG: hypothetical protein U0637_04605 [Phycisphaerales bacterium]